MIEPLSPPSESWLQTLDRALRGGFTDAETVTEPAALPVDSLPVAPQTPGPWNLQPGKQVFHIRAGRPTE